MDRFKCKGRPTGHHGFLPPSSGGPLTAKALHRRPLRLAQLAALDVSFQDILRCLVMKWPGKTGPGILQCPFLQGFTSGPWKLPHYPLFGWFCVQNACQFISCPCALQSKMATKGWIPEKACGVDIPLSLSLSFSLHTLPYFFPHDIFLASSWLISQSMLSTQILNDLQKIRFKTSFVSRSPWYSSIYSQGPTHWNRRPHPPAFRQSLPLGGSGQRKKVPSTSRRKPTKYSLFLVDRRCWQWSVMIHLCPKNGVF